MNTQQPNGGYGLRQNIVTTNHAPGSIHRSATRRKNHPFSPQPGTVPQPDFGVMNAQGAPATGQVPNAHGAQVDQLDPFDTSIGQFDDAYSAPSATAQSLSGAEAIRTYIGELTPDELQSLCMPVSLTPDSSGGNSESQPQPHTDGFQTPERPDHSPSSPVSNSEGGNKRLSGDLASDSPSPGRIPKDRKAIMESCFSQIESLLDKAAQATNRKRANIFSLFANTQTLKRSGRTMWNMYESYYYEDPEREQNRAEIPGADCT